MHLKYSQGQAFYKLYTALLDIPSWTINLLKYTYIFILYFNRIDTVIFRNLNDENKTVLWRHTTVIYNWKYSGNEEKLYYVFYVSYLL